MSSVAVVSPAELATREKRNFLPNPILLTQDSCLWLIRLGTGTYVSKEMGNGQPPTLNLALTSQMQVKGERSSCRMTQIASTQLRLPEGHSELAQNSDGSRGITHGGAT